MSQQHSFESTKWDELDHRTTHYGLELILRRSLVDEHISTVAITPEGDVLEFGDKKAVEAYYHPAATPGLTERSVDVTYNPWDKALDALNELPEEQHVLPLEIFQKMYQGNMPNPTFLVEAVTRARRLQINKAA